MMEVLDECDSKIIGLEARKSSMFIYVPSAEVGMILLCIFI
jgi:hypothetical protein